MVELVNKIKAKSWVDLKFFIGNCQQENIRGQGNFRLK
jgi:hypothetical protein